MAGIGWNRLKLIDWMAMAGALSALVPNMTVRITILSYLSIVYKVDIPMSAARAICES